MPRGALRAKSWVLLAWVSLGAAACVIETEGAAPKPPLLRDTLRNRPPAPSSSAAPSASIAPAESPRAAAVPEAFRACESSADCEAVLPNGCCQDGRQEALNKGLVDAYRSTFRCPTEHPACPTQLVLDSRMPYCDTSAHLCKLAEGPPPHVQPGSTPGNAGGG